MTRKQVDDIVKKLWPIGCLEDGDNDPWTKRADGYCDALKDMAREVKKLIGRK